MNSKAKVNPKTKTDTQKIEQVTGFSYPIFIDKGAFGKVYRAKDGSEEVAIKSIELRKDHASSLKGNITEILVHRHLQGGQNVVDFIHAFSDSDHIWIVMKFYPSSLRSVMVGTPLQDDAVRRLLRDILQGVAFMHDRGLVHCDIKPENVLVDYDGTAVIADFGLTTPAHLAEPEDHVVTRFYRAPELACLLPWGYPVDLWSVGCIAFELLSQAKNVKQPNYLFRSEGSTLSDYEGPFDKTDLYTILTTVGTMQGPYAELGSHSATPTQRGLFYSWSSLPRQKGTLEQRYAAATPVEGQELVAHLLNVDPRYRLTAVEALDAHYFHGYEVVKPTAAPMTKKEADQFSEVQNARPAPPLMYERCVVKRLKVDRVQEFQNRLMSMLGVLTSTS